MNTFSQNDESVRDEILEYMNKKYNEEFTALSLDRGYTDVLLCMIQGGDPEADLILAQRITGDSGVVFKDTYFGNIIREDVEFEILSVCSILDIPMKAIYHSGASYYDNIFDGTKGYDDLKQWISDGNLFRFTVTIVLPLDAVDDSEVYAEQIYTLLSNANYQGLAYVCILPLEGFLEATRANLNNLINQYHEQSITCTKSIN